MKYFTKKLWGDSPTAAGAGAGWDKARRAYWKQLDAMRSRFAPEAFAFFERADVHEGELLHVDVIDGSRPAPPDQPPRPWASPSDHPVRVELALLDVYDRLEWTLRYAAVRRVLVDFAPAPAPLPPLIDHAGAGFGPLGLHELTDRGDGFFRHEIVFASGASLLVEFREVEVGQRERR